MFLGQINHVIKMNKHSLIVGIVLKIAMTKESIAMIGLVKIIDLSIKTIKNIVLETLTVMMIAGKEIG